METKKKLKQGGGGGEVFDVLNLKFLNSSQIYTPNLMIIT